MKYLNHLGGVFQKSWLIKSLRIMKLTFIIVLISCMQVSAKSYSQTLTLNLKSVELKKALATIEKHSDFRFLYSERNIGRNEKVDINVTNANIEQVMDQLLSGTGLSFKELGNNLIVLVQKDGVVEDVFVKGKVTDKATGRPLEGVSVQIKGSNAGTNTDNKGNYSINVPDKAILTFSSVGYNNVTIPVNGQKVINVSMQISTVGLDEVLVVAYGTQSKSTLTGSVSTLNPEAYEGAPGRPSAIQSIQGNVTGVQTMNSSGQPGTSGNTRIRGIGSINASQTPLYVVDGVPIVTSDVSGYGSDPLAGINPDDIASLTVLKDAAASSIYGSRAANGVIIITTKKGKPGKTAINFSIQQGVNDLTLTEREMPLNTSEMIELLREGWVNSGKDVAGFQAELDKNGVDTTINTDWIDALTRRGTFSQYNLSASGGNDKTQFFSSAGYYVSDGALRGVDYKRGTARMTVSSEVSDRLSFNAGMSGYYQLTHAVSDAGGLANPVRSIYRLQPWLPIYNPDGSYDFSYNSTHNPVATYRDVKREGISYKVSVNLDAKLKLFPGLTYEPRVSGALTSGIANRFYSPAFGDGRNVGGRGSVETNVYKNWVTTNILRYKHSFNVDHSVEGFVGYEAQKIVNTGNYAEATNFLPGLETLNAASLPTSASSSISSNTLVGTFVNGNYDYKKVVFLSASFRRDGSSRFGEKKRFANFWSVGAGWSIAKTFLQDVSYVSDLKLRASYGINGNQGIGNFASKGLYGSGNDYNGEPGYAFSQYENPLLTWEQNKPFDIGLDFGLFKNRLSGSIDYYKRTTSNLLLDVPISGTNGLTSYTVNYGAMENKGWEISLSSKNIVKSKGNGFSWQTDFNISTLENKITKLSSPLTSSTYKRDVGDNYYTFDLYAYAGVDPATGQALWYSSTDKSQTTTKYDEAVRIPEGTATPDFFGGLTNRFSYGNFKFSFLLYYNWGNKIYDGWGRYTDSDGSSGFSATGKISRYTYEHRWQKPGDETDVPAVIYKGKQTGTSSMSSSRFLYDGSYVRLRDITLGYSLPSSITRSLKINDVQVYFRANNLFTYVKDKRLTFDPEVSIDGSLDQRPPVFRTLTLGLDIKF